MKTSKVKKNFIWVLIILLLNAEVLMMSIQQQNFRNGHQISTLQFSPTKLFMIPKIRYRKTGKKETSNFQAKYKYGNKTKKESRMCI